MVNREGAFRSYFGAVAVPILDAGDGTISNVTHDWANATAGLGGGLAVTIMRMQIKNYRVDIAKQRLAEMALANKCQFVLFVDDDVLIPGEALMKMVQKWKTGQYKIISGVYWSKSDPMVPLVFKGNLEGSFWDWKTTDFIQADGAGAGCLFVDTDIFRKMPKPWFAGDYYFDDPRAQADVTSWELRDALAEELLKGTTTDKVRVQDLEKQLKAIGDEMGKMQAGGFDPNMLKGRRSDGATTEDLYFFKKAKEYLGAEGQLWVDCSIQCAHQDKRTGRIFAIRGDMPQAKASWDGQYAPGDAVVLDLGSGEPNYSIIEGKPIRVDIDPTVKPDVVADVRWLPFDDCFADQINASHCLEHISFRETVTTLKEWVRTLKIGGKLCIIVPNLKWAARNIMNGTAENDEEFSKRTMFFFYSGQEGDLRSAYNDVHRAGFTPQSMKSILSQLGTLKDIEIHTTEGQFGSWADLGNLHDDDFGYNLIAFATKVKHNAPMSFKMPFKDQEEAKFHIGEQAKKMPTPTEIINFAKDPSKPAEKPEEIAPVKKTQKGKHDNKV